jgi:flagellar protein FlgJ
MQTINSGLDMDMMRVNATTAQRVGDMKKAKNAALLGDGKKLDDIATEFEAQFIASMLENMFVNVDTDGPLGGGDAEKTYRSFMNDEYGKLIAKSGGIGVADHVKREMLRMQEMES